MPVPLHEASAEQWLRISIRLYAPVTWLTGDVFYGATWRGAGAVWGEIENGLLRINDARAILDAVRRDSTGVPFVHVPDAARAGYAMYLLWRDGR